MDNDLASIQAARDLIQQAKSAQSILQTYSQEEVDRLVEKMAEYGFRASRELAELACAETGLGKLESKVEKNRFATKEVHEHLKTLKTVGIISCDHEKKVYEVAAPMGLVTAIVPVTNPTSTALHNMLISIKARCCVVLSPHPRALKSVQRSVEIMQRAADSIGVPKNIVGCLPISSMVATKELMTHKDIRLILATGGGGLVKAAYSSGKPALGVGPGNVPAFIERTANVAHAVNCLAMSQSFDWGTFCCSEQSVIVDKSVEQECITEFKRQGGYLCTPEETKSLEKLMPPGSAINPDLVGQSPTKIAQLAGFRVPEDTKVILARQTGVGDAHPLSREKLSPILAFYTVQNWQEGSKLATELLRYGGAGHTVALHSKSQDVIAQFGITQPASRIIVNGPSGPGGCGYGTGIVPSLTLGCGSEGGNITSDNVSSHNLLNIKRIAFGETAFFSDIPAPAVPFMESKGGNGQTEVKSPFRSSFTEDLGKKKTYFVGPYNNPNI